MIHPTKPKFDFSIPLVTLIASGWLIAGYFAFAPGYKESTYVLESTSFGVIPPLMFVYIFIVANCISWGIAGMIYLKGDES